MAGHLHQAGCAGRQEPQGSGTGGEAKRLVEIVRADPFGIPPIYEGLVGSLSGLYSRRINIRHRFVYSVDATPVDYDNASYEGTVKVVRMWTRYEGMRG